jgi:hypothetical protein
MSKAALLDFIPEARRKLIYHEEDGKTFIETRQECTPLIEAAKILADVPPNKEDGWRFLCVIPDTVFNQAAIEGWLHDKAKWRQWMNDSDNRAFNGGRSSVS